jgi:hypothetical protein
MLKEVKLTIFKSIKIFSRLITYLSQTFNPPYQKARKVNIKLLIRVREMNDPSRQNLTVDITCECQVCATYRRKYS